MRPLVRMRFCLIGLSALAVCLAYGDRCHGQPVSGFGSRSPAAPHSPAAQPVDSTHPLSSLPFQNRIDRHLSTVGEEAAGSRGSPIPPNFRPWWQRDVSQPQRAGQRPLPLDLDTLLIEALQFSPQVQALRETDLIRSTSIIEAEAEFDSRAFMESKMIRTSDPVGDDLTTGGPPRFRDSTWYYLAGARKRTQRGGTMELSQRLGYRDNNSVFLNPTQQGNARLSLSFTQPLLNGAGKTYNHSRIVLAHLDTRVAHNEVTIGLQSHLVQVSRAYWDLYFRRAVLRQKQLHYRRGREILSRLEDRREVDSMQSQILAARAAVAVRHADLNRAEMAIRNAESRIRILVSSPTLYGQGRQELLPVTPTADDWIDVPIRDALATALYHRAEVDRAIQQTRMAAVRLNMSTKELLPQLSLVFETYVAGLEGRSSVGQAWVNQFSVGEPGYTAGLLLEVPLGNRAARARYERRQAEMRQLTGELQVVVDATMLEVEVALRSVQTAFRDIQANFQSMTSTQAEVDYLQDRWIRLPGDDRSASFLLEDLLRAQDRLSDAEFAFAESQVAHTLAQIQLKQAMGVLLGSEPWSPGSAAPPHPEPLPNAPPTRNFSTSAPPPSAPSTSASPRNMPLTDPPPRRAPSHVVESRMVESRAAPPTTNRYPLSPPSAPPPRATIERLPPID